MKTRILKEQLAEANGAVRELVAKDGLSPFSRVRLDAVGPNVSLTGSNGDVQLEYRMDGETAENGTLALPGGLLGRFVDSLPEGVVDLDGEANTRVKISADAGVTFRLSAGDAMDYPVMAGPKPGCGGMDVEAALLREMLRKVKFAAEPDGSTRRELCGVNVKLKGGKLEMTATDGRRLAHVEKDIDADPEFDIILANKAVKMLFGLLEDGDCVTIRADGAGARFTADRWNLTTKAVDAKYPEWEKVVPKNTRHTAKLDRVSFLTALGRAALSAGENNAVKVTLKDGLTKFEAKNDLSAASAETILCTIEDKAKATFMFNWRLLKDALDAIDDDDFTLDFSGEGAGPVVLKCSLPWLAVIMPLLID